MNVLYVMKVMEECVLLYVMQKNRYYIFAIEMSKKFLVIGCIIEFVVN